MGAKSFVSKLMRDSIEGFIEESWDRDEYLIEDERTFLVQNGVMYQWRDAYLKDLVGRFQGTCNSFTSREDEFLEEFNAYDDFDNEIFECGDCGWWCETSERHDTDSGESVCEQCYGEEEE
ncbi:MAG: hypothetical protein ACI9M3_001887 [Bacteroidia bacterium]|jgi:hypothetical protein